MSATQEPTPPPSDDLATSVGDQHAAVHQRACDKDDAATGERKRTRSTPNADANPTVLKCMRMHKDAALPRRGTPGAAGYDLSAVEATTVPPRGRAQVRTGLAIAVPLGHYGRVAPRSSMARQGLDVGAGVLDADYRGEVGVMLFNHGDDAYIVEAGARIAQLLIEKIAHPEPEWADALDDTERGSGGFGSTGR